MTCQAPFPIWARLLQRTLTSDGRSNQYGFTGVFHAAAGTPGYMKMFALMARFLRRVFSTVPGDWPIIASVLKAQEKQVKARHELATGRKN